MFRHVMLSTDFSPPSVFAAHAAATIALRVGAKVTLAHVHGPDDDVAPREEGLRLLAEERFAQLEDVDLKLIEGEHADVALAVVAKDVGADLLVAARHGEHRLDERLLGSTTERLVRHAPCSVLVVHPARRERIELMKHVMVGTDFSPSAKVALDMAKGIAGAFEAWVTLVHVWDIVPTELLEEPLKPGEGPHDFLDRKLAEVQHEVLGEASTERLLIRDKSPVVTLCDEAGDRDVDLLVVGTHGRTGLGRLLLGSVAERVVRHAPCSVLVTRTLGEDGKRDPVAALGARIV